MSSIKRIQTYIYKLNTSPFVYISLHTRACNTNYTFTVNFIYKLSNKIVYWQLLYSMYIYTLTNIASILTNISLLVKRYIIIQEFALYLLLQIQKFKSTLSIILRSFFTSSIIIRQSESWRERKKEKNKPINPDIFIPHKTTSMNQASRRKLVNNRA